VERGCSVSGRVSIAVVFEGYFRRRARRACRNWRMWVGLQACDAYRAGERREGIMILWTAVGEADSWVVRWVMNVVKGESVGSGSVKSRV
jgi:hypothetical protein